MGPVLVATAQPAPPTRIKFLGPILFEPGQSRELRHEITEVDAPFRVTNFAVPSDMKLAPFMIHDVRRNGASQAVSSNPIPVLAFSEEAFGVNLGIDTLRYGDSITVVLSNQGSEPAIFVGLLYGVTESNVPPDPKGDASGPNIYVVGFGPTAVNPGQAAFEVEVKMDYEPIQLIFPASLGQGFDILSLTVAGEEQLALGPTPAKWVDENQRQRNANLGKPSAFNFHTKAKKGDKIRLVVHNKTQHLQTISAAMLGKGEPGVTVARHPSDPDAPR